MKTRVFPAPKGMPARIGQIQWMVMGTDVQENQSCPMGMRQAAMQTMLTDASGVGRLVSGSFLWAWITFRARGSETIAIIVPVPMPVKARPLNPADHPRRSV